MPCKKRGRRRRTVSGVAGVRAPVGTPVYGPCRGRGIGLRNDGQDSGRYPLLVLYGLGLLFYTANKAIKRY